MQTKKKTWISIKKLKAEGWTKKKLIKKKVKKNI